MAEKGGGPEQETETDVIDAEIIDDSTASAPQDAGAQARPVSSAPAPARKSGRLGWYVAGLLAAFIGGVAVTPYAKSSLQDLGLLAAPEPLAESLAPAASGVDQAAIAAQQARIEDLERRLSLQQETIAQYRDDAAAAAGARDALQRDVALLAAQTPAAADGSAPTETIRALETQVARLSDELARLTLLTEGENPAVTNLTGSLALARAETGQLKSRLDSLSAALEAMQAGSIDASPRGRLLLSLARLKDQALDGEPLGSGLDAFRIDIAALPALDQQLAGADIAVLAAHADGITPYASLVRDFDGVARAAKQAQEKTDGSMLANLFTVRRTDAGATGIDAQLLAAERRLLARDLEGAVVALGGLSGDALEAVTPWRDRAQAHGDVLAAMARLQRTLAGSRAGAGR